MITAQKNNITRNFDEHQWNNMPKNKFGWVPVPTGTITPNLTSADIIQKKMVAGQVVGAEKVVPDEIIKAKSKKEKLSEEIKTKRVRQPK